MSRHDYGAIAGIIRRNRCLADGPHANQHMDEMVDDLISYFSSQNTKFDAERFRKAASGSD